jgi:hypothetical protein
MKALTIAIAGAAILLLGHGPASATDLEPQHVVKEFPTFRADSSWPKQLPNKWRIGQVGGIAVDRHDNIWIVQRPRSLNSSEAGALGNTDPETGDILLDDEGNPISVLGHARPFGPIADCCLPAPSVMQFDTEGNLLQAWGGPADPGFIGGRCKEEDGCVWHAGEHGIFVDHNDNVYLAGNGTGTGATPWAATHGPDSHLLKFSKDGTFLLNIGDAGVEGPDSNDTAGASNGTPQLFRPADSEVDPQTNELYIADGYGNRRIVVVDADTGLYKRHWGAYGQVPVVDPDPPLGPYAEDRDAGITPPHFRTPVHCVRITHDRKVYVCDRVNNRIQVFETNGTFITEKFIRRETLGNGSVWDLDTSPDRQQSCLYNVDGTSQYADVIRRHDLELLDTFGQGGRNAGLFHWVHNVAVDSRGNLYTAEVDTGTRPQKFVPTSSRNNCQ